MKLQVKSNGHVVEMKKEIYDNLPEDSQRGYTVLDTKDTAEVKEPTVKNEVKKEIPPTGDKSEGKK